MASLLSAKNNNFVFKIPRTFFFEDVVKEYEPYIKRSPLPFNTLEDYINSSVQSVSFPSVQGPTVNQTNYDDPMVWKGRGDMYRWMSRELTVTFKLYDAYLNYWIMLDELMKFYDYHTTIQSLGDFTLQFLDNSGFESCSFFFERIVYTGISNLELSYASNIPEFQTFTCDFVYTYPKLMKRKQ